MIDDYIVLISKINSTIALLTTDGSYLWARKLSRILPSGILASSIYIHDVSLGENCIVLNLSSFSYSQNNSPSPPYDTIYTPTPNSGYDKRCVTIKLALTSPSVGRYDDIEISSPNDLRIVGYTNVHTWGDYTSQFLNPSVVQRFNGTYTQSNEVAPSVSYFQSIHGAATSSAVLLANGMTTVPSSFQTTTAEYLYQPNNNIYTVYAVGGFMSFSAYIGLICHDTRGNLKWRNKFQVPGKNHFLYEKSIVVHKTQGVFIVANVQSPQTGTIEDLNVRNYPKTLLLIHCDHNGNLVRSRFLTDTYLGGFRGETPADIVPVKVTLSSYGPVVLCVNESQRENPSSVMPSLISYDFNGNVRWQKYFERTSQYNNHNVGRPVQDCISDGSSIYVAAGMVLDSNSGYSYLDGINTEFTLLKFDANTGNLLWSRKLGSFGIASTLSFDTDGNILICGRASGYNVGLYTNLIAKISVTGSLIYIHGYSSGAFFPHNIFVTLDGFKIVAWGGDGNDGYMAKIDSNGDVVKQTRLSSSGGFFETNLGVTSINGGFITISGLTGLGHSAYLYNMYDSDLFFDIKGIDSTDYWTPIYYDQIITVTKLPQSLVSSEEGFTLTSSAITVTNSSFTASTSTGLTAAAETSGTTITRYNLKFKPYTRTKAFQTTKIDI